MQLVIIIDENVKLKQNTAMLPKKFAIVARTLIIVLSLFLQHSVDAQNTKSNQNNSGFIENMNNSFINFKDSVSGNFSNFQEQQQQAFDDFKKQIQKKWGSGNFAYSDSVNWVEYYEDNNVRSTVNFKEGNANIELLIESDEEIDNKDIEEDVGEAIKEMALTKGKKIDFDVEEEGQNELSEKPILENQLITKEGEKVSEDNIDQFTKEIVSKKEIKQTKVKGTDGKSRTMVSISIPLAPDYLKVRAEKLLPIVTKYSKQYGIEPELILSVIHVESYFNPKAISHANAIGLMQLVPSSGGMDSYNYVFNKNTEPSIKFLYDSDNNINLGTAYLRILMTRYFGDVVNSDSKRYCVVSSYNTGVGNVCRTVSGNTIVHHTVNKINALTPSKTYRFLSQNLKYKEARNYIVKVNDKYLMYKNWLVMDNNF